MSAISYDLTDESLGWNCYCLIASSFPHPGHLKMPFIPCGFGDNWLLRNPSPAAISTQQITILIGAIRDLNKTRPRRQARVLNGDLRVKCFFFFLQPMIAILQAPSITLHGPITMSGCMFTAGYHGSFFCTEYCQI